MAVDTDTCRLCLRPIDKANCTDLMTETTKLIMLKDLLPKVNFEVCKNTIVCNNCIQELETFYNFKRGVIVNETNIQTKLDQNGLKIMDLKLMLDDVAKKGILDDDYLCRICLSICRTPNISLFDSPSNVMPYSFVKKMCQVVFELEFIASDKPVLCNKCWEALQAIYNFRKNCLRTDKKLQIYITSRNITLLSLDEFKIFANENLPKGDNENSSDEELDGYIKEEPLDHDNFEFDHYEPLCSLNSVIVNEEVSIKDEYELKIEDEPEMLDPKDISEVDELGGENCNMEIEDIKIDLDAIGSFEPFGLPIMNYTVRGGSTNKKRKTTKQLECTECSYKCSEAWRMKRHQVTHKKPDEIEWFYCAECSFKTKRKSALNRHFLTHRDPDRIRYCTLCPYKTKTARYFESHLLTHKFVVKPTEKVECAQCSKRLRDKSSLIRHINVMHKMMPGNHPPQKMCEYCPYKYRYETHLKRHLECHKKVLSCPQCSFTTRWSVGLKNHAWAHTSRKFEDSFVCAQCLKIYRSKKYLEDHISSVHNVKR